MARKIRATGGFYSFISHGLGREFGMAAGICGALAYSLFEVSLLGGFAYFANTNFNDWFGWNIPWPLFAFGAAALISVLCFYDVELSVRVLGFALIGEIVILTVFDVLVFAQGGGPSGIQFEALNPFKLTDPGPGLAAGVGLFLAFWSWVGFEATPNYAEESKDPKRIVPRATLISVVGLGIGYVITSLAFVSSFAQSGLVKAAQDPEGPFFVAMRGFGSHWLATIMQVLILTGSFACAMAFHNVAMRYFYAMGREGVLPRALGRTHPVHRSPHVANFAQTGLAVALVLVWAVGAGFGKPFDVAYVRIYTMMAVQGVVWILGIQVVCAIAIIVYHRRNRFDDHWLVTVVCPLIAIAGQVFAIYLLFKNINVLAGTIGYVDFIWPIAVAAVLGALGYAFWLKYHDRPKYELIGRMIDEGIAPEAATDTPAGPSVSPQPVPH
jgi:amino acid transporter